MAKQRKLTKCTLGPTECTVEASETRQLLSQSTRLLSFKQDQSVLKVGIGTL
jgi:hypothetical protein